MGRAPSLARALDRLRAVLDLRRRHRLAARRSPRASKARGGDGGLFRARSEPSAQLPRGRAYGPAAQGDDRGLERHVRRLAIVLPRALRRLRSAVRAVADDAVRELAAGRDPDRSRDNIRRRDEHRRPPHRHKTGARRRAENRTRRTRLGRARQSAGDPKFWADRGRVRVGSAPSATGCWLRNCRS